MSWGSLGCCMVLCGVSIAARSEEPPSSVQAQRGSDEHPAESIPPEAKSDPPEPKKPPTVLEGALGPVAHWNLGDGTLSWTPGFYRRYGRLSISNNGHFAVRRRDDLFRGVGLDVSTARQWALNVGLRLDRGGRASGIGALAGHDDIPSTVRLRLAAVYRPLAQWSVVTSWNGDVMGRGGGQSLELGVSREQALDDQIRWSLGWRLSAADARYQRTHFGITPEQSALAGVPAYQPSSGWLHSVLSSSLRFDMGPHWVSFVGASVLHRMGPQVHSPLVAERTSWVVGAGIARRF